MLTNAEIGPFIVLIDDDEHSAHLLRRTLAAQGAPSIRHFSDPESGEAALANILSDPVADWPDLILVDLKAHSGANLDFVIRNRETLGAKDVPMAVLVPSTDGAVRDAWHKAGADAVFFRQAELSAYRHEAAAILDFWARGKRLDAIGM